MIAGTLKTLSKIDPGAFAEARAIDPDTHTRKVGCLESDPEKNWLSLKIISELKTII
jgi:hypothetical protein